MNNKQADRLKKPARFQTYNGTTERCDGCGIRHPKGTLARDNKDGALLYCSPCKAKEDAVDKETT